MRNAALLCGMSLCLVACIHTERAAAPDVSDPPVDTSVGLTPRCRRGGPCGYVNAAGDFVIGPQWKWVKPFYEGRASVDEQNVGWGVIDSDGKYVVSPSFAVIGPFSEGLAAACPSDKNYYKWVYLDRSGKVAIELDYNVQRAYPFHGGRGWVTCPFWFSSMSKQIDRTGRVKDRIYPR